MDKVKFYKESKRFTRYPNVEVLTNSISSRYMKIRADLECIGGEICTLVRHIKSFEDWEYFIDVFCSDKKFYNFDDFNYVKVLGNNIVVLLHSPDLSINGINNKEIGTCTVDDIINIENIIKDRKKFYEEK